MHLVPNDRPWMTALEQQFAAMKNCAEWRREATRPRLPGNTDNDLDRRPLVSLLKSAATYSWSRDSVTAVRLASKTVPDTTILNRSQLPTAAGWWWFDGGLDEEEFVALLWGPTEDDHLAVCCFVMIGTDIDQGFSFMWKFGTAFDDLRAEAGTVGPGAGRTEPLPDDALATLTDVARFFIAGCAWLQQRVLTTTIGHVERHLRRRLQREHDTPIASDVNVIQLRRVESRYHDDGQDGDAVDWSCRWIVNGHWRNQPYKDGSKLIYIMPFVKGPADKPLKVPTHTVYAVNR